METETELRKALPLRVITVIAGYKKGEFTAYVALYEFMGDDSFRLEFPHGHNFAEGQRVTLHLDNRTGVDEYDADRRVYRLSYRGIVVRIDGISLTVQPEEYMMFYSNRCVRKYTSPGFRYEEEMPEGNSLPPSDLSLSRIVWNEREHENKLGVLFFRMPSRPHSTLMAFHSTVEDDIFMKSLKGTFKSRLLHNNRNCCLAIDHRAEFLFEKAYQWNYTIIEADAPEMRTTGLLRSPL